MIHLLDNALLDNTLLISALLAHYETEILTVMCLRRWGENPADIITWFNSCDLNTILKS